MADNLDKIDLSILRILQENADLNINEISERVGLSHTPCWRRIKKMQESGVIKAQVCHLDSEKIGLDISIFVFVRLNTHSSQALETFEEATKSISEIMQCYTMSGEFDYILRVVVASVRNYEKTVKGQLLNLPYVGVLNSHFALSEIKNTSAFPI